MSLTKSANITTASKLNNKPKRTTDSSKAAGAKRVKKTTSTLLLSNAQQNHEKKTQQRKMQKTSSLHKGRSAKTSLNLKRENMPSLKVIPLGGLGEVGKNITVFECEDDIILVDCGLKFPDETMYGIDFVIADFAYLLENQAKIRGLFITHGHEDHIGGIPYLISNINVPIYGTKLAMGLLERKLEEKNLLKGAQINVVKCGMTISVKGFSVEFVATNHSIPDAAALFIRCKGYKVFHTGDYKIDYTPVDGTTADLQRMAQIGSEGVDLMLADSTSAEKEGFTKSESSIGESFHTLFDTKKRIIVASFSTNVHRLQQVFDEAKFYKRKVALSGRSMVNVVTVAHELKYLKFKDSMLIDLKDVGKFLPEQLVILTTGSQGEPLSALTRMSQGEHRQFKPGPDDRVIISATPIPGNEKTVGKVINSLLELGSDVIYQGMEDVHVSGHGRQEELKLMLALIKPQYFMPVHGEFKMLSAAKNVAVKMGMPSDHVFLMENGDVLEISSQKASVSGKVTAGIVLIDGIGVGDVGNIVLKDRKKLSEDGLVIVAMTLAREGLVAGPDIVSRGFVYMKESEDLIGEIKDITVRVVYNNASNVFDYNTIKTAVRSELEKFLYEKTQRKPMVLPIIMYAK